MVSRLTEGAWAMSKKANAAQCLPLPVTIAPPYYGNDNHNAYKTVDGAYREGKMVENIFHESIQEIKFYLNYLLKLPVHNTLHSPATDRCKLARSEQGKGDIIHH